MSLSSLNPEQATGRRAGKISNIKKQITNKSQKQKIKYQNSLKF